MCHGVLYKQLSAWMLHGLLLDVKGEFFVELQPREAAVSPEGSKVSGGMGESMPHHQGKGFVIQHALAPSYLPLRVLEKVRLLARLEAGVTSWPLPPPSRFCLLGRQ